MKIKTQLIAGALLATFGSLAMAQTLVGVSWSNFQEERWKTDEAAIKTQLAKLGGAYVSADAPIAVSGIEQELYLRRHTAPVGRARRGTGAGRVVTVAPGRRGRAGVHPRRTGSAPVVGTHHHGVGGAHSRARVPTSPGGAGADRCVDIDLDVCAG